VPLPDVTGAILQGKLQALEKSRYARKRFPFLNHQAGESFPQVRRT